MRGFGSICAVLLALSWVSLAHADEPATSGLDATLSPEGIRSVVTGLRQSIVDNGLSQALTHAGDWVKELEVSWSAHRNEHASLDTDADDASDLNLAEAAAVTVSHATAFVSRPYSLNLGLVTFGTNGADDPVWAIGHAQPLTSAALAGTAADADVDHRGNATGERSLASHDLQIGLRVPMMPWQATISADKYWWGMRGFGPQVSGSRVGLKLSPVANFEIEGGRAEDTRGNGGFVGLLYHVPLDQP
jgi:hypothetical protein